MAEPIHNTVTPAPDSRKSLSPQKAFDLCISTLNDASDKVSDAIDLLRVISLAEGSREDSPEASAICTAIEYASGTFREVSAMINDVRTLVMEQRQ